MKQSGVLTTSEIKYALIELPNAYGVITRFPVVLVPKKSEKRLQQSSEKTIKFWYRLGEKVTK